MTRYRRNRNRTETRRNEEKLGGGGVHRPELDGTEGKCVEYAGSYRIVQYLGSVNPDSYPCRRIRTSDLWCRRRRDVNHRDQSYELQKEIRTDRTDNHYEGPVPTTYPCPQSSS